MNESVNHKFGCFLGVAVVSVLLGACDGEQLVVNPLDLQPSDGQLVSTTGANGEHGGNGTNGNNNLNDGVNGISGTNNIGVNNGIGNENNGNNNGNNEADVLGGPSILNGSLDNDYFLTRIEGDTCLSVGESETYRVIGSYFDQGFSLQEHNLSSFAVVSQTTSGVASVVSAGDAGFSVQLNNQNVVSLTIDVGDQSFQHSVAAISEATSLPVILEKQTGDWCIFVRVGKNGACSSVTGSRTGSSASSNGLSVTNCILDNSDNTPVIKVDE